jgi:uncharacterized protein
MWSEGDVVVGRHLVGDRPWHVWTGTVVRDDSDVLAVWLPRGAERLWPVGSLFGEWTYERSRISAPELRLSSPGVAHSILLFWSETDEFRGWYVNLEDPLRRTELGYDYEDHFLDVWVEPDGSWRWLDEDELEEAVERGMLGDAKAREIRAEGERVVEAWPFPTGWEDFRPDPAWPLPTFPEGWDAP